MENRLEYVARSLANGSKKIYETYVINCIYQKIGDPQLEIQTQKYVCDEKGGREFIDLYLPQIKIAIEIDEGHHTRQQEHDLKRELLIQEKLINLSPANNIQILRIKAHDVSLEELNKDIDEKLAIIRKLIDQVKPLKWLTYEEKVELIRQKKVIDTNDYFYNNYEIINLLYNKEFKGWQKGTYKKIWFPEISIYDKATKQFSSRATWVNYFNTINNIIYEKSLDETKNAEKMKWAESDKQNRKIRITFVKERDEFGKPRKRFAGVFRADGWDPLQKAEIWKQISTELEFPLDD